MKGKDIIKWNDPSFYVNLFFSGDIKMIQPFKNSPETAGAIDCGMNPKCWNNWLECKREKENRVS